MVTLHLNTRNSCRKWKRWRPINKSIQQDGDCGPILTLCLGGVALIAMRVVKYTVIHNILHTDRVATLNSAYKTQFTFGNSFFLFTKLKWEMIKIKKNKFKYLYRNFQIMLTYACYAPNIFYIKIYCTCESSPYSFWFFPCSSLLIVKGTIKVDDI